MPRFADDNEIAVLPYPLQLPRGDEWSRQIETTLAHDAGQIVRELPHLAGNLIHDTHTAVLVRERGVRRICTRDMDFHRFSILEVIDPA